jgi:gluconokinase
MNQLGVGALRPGVMTLSVGTSAAARMVRSKPEAMAAEGTWCYYAPTSWLGGVATAGATSCLDWFMHHFAGEVTYKEFEKDLTIKKDNPYFLPFLFGERCPGWNDNRSGGFYCLRSKHSKQDLYGAVLEGVLYNMYHAYQYLVKASSTPKTILLSGGITNSALWIQMIADIWQRSFCILRDSSQASMLGGAAVAMHILGELPDITNINIDYKNSVTISPRPEMASLYAERFAEYKMLYEQDHIIAF